MEAQRQRMEVPEYVQRDAPDGALRHADENEITQLREERGGQTQRAVGDEQRQRQRKHGLRRCQPIDDLLEHERNGDVRELGRDEEDERDRDAPAVLPQVWEQHGDDTPLARARWARGSGYGGHKKNGRGVSAPEDVPKEEDENGRAVSPAAFIHRVAIAVPTPAPST